jgi:hypothetical protein
VRRSQRVQHVQVEESDSDEETPEEKAARLWEIKMHKLSPRLFVRSLVLTILRKLLNAWKELGSQRARNGPKSSKSGSPVQIERKK